MSFAEPLWERYRDQFPVTGRLIYLNHAGVAPLCRPAAEAMQSLAVDACHYGSLHYDHWLDAYEGLRVAAARLLHAHRDEVAIVKNTSEGIATVALGFPWKNGDKIVGFREEFPANWYPWQRLHSRGVHVEWLSCEDPLDRIDEACRGARLLAISFVQYLSGFRANLNAIGEICRRHGVFFFVDAIQGLGAFPLDVEAAHVDALAADGHKWMLGPEGCGLLYIRREHLDHIEPVEFGYTNVAAPADYGTRQTELRRDAARYEPGTLNTIGVYGLRAAVDFLLEVGIDPICADLQAVGDRLAAGLRSLGCELLGNRTPAAGSGIVSFRKPDEDCRVTVQRFKNARIIAAARQGWVRLSPHFYISPDEIETVLSAV